MKINKLNKIVTKWGKQKGLILLVKVVQAAYFNL